MTDSQQNHELAGSQPQRQRRRSPIGGLVQEFEQAVGDFKQALSPRGARTSDKLATPSTLLDSWQTSPPCTDSRSRSPSLGVRVASPRSGIEHVSLVTDAVLDTRIEQLTLAMHAHVARAISEGIASFDSTLRGSFDALEARCEALEKKAEGPPRNSSGTSTHQESVEALELANQQMVVRLETLQSQASMLHDSLKAQEQECKALDSLRLLGPRLDKMSQDHEESVVALDSELQRLEGMLRGPAPSVEADLQKIFLQMDDFKDQLHDLRQAQIQDQNDSSEVNQFQKELGRRVDDKMNLLKGKVDEVTHMVQEDLMEAADDDCRWELQYRALEIETAGDPPPLASGSLTARLESKSAIVFQHTLPAEVTRDSEPPPSPQTATLGLTELQRKIDQKLDMSLRQVDELVMRHEAKLQQFGEVGNQYWAVQQCVDELRVEIGSVRGDLDVLRTDKVLNHVRSIASLFGPGVPEGMTAYTEV